MLLLALLLRRSGSASFWASAKAVLLTVNWLSEDVPSPKWRTVSWNLGQSTPAVQTGRLVIVQLLSDTADPDGARLQLPSVAVPATVFSEYWPALALKTLLRVSVTATLVAACGPALTTSISQTIGEPASWRLPAPSPRPSTRLSTDTSACAALACGFTPTPVQSLAGTLSAGALAAFTHTWLVSVPPAAVACALMVTLAVVALTPSATLVLVQVMVTGPACGKVPPPEDTQLKPDGAEMLLTRRLAGTVSVSVRVPLAGIALGPRLVAEIV